MLEVIGTRAGCVKYTLSVDQLDYIKAKVTNQKNASVELCLHEHLTAAA